MAAMPSKARNAACRVRRRLKRKSGHFTDDMGIMGDTGSDGIRGPTIGLGGGTWREIAGEKGMKASRRIIGDLAKAAA